MKKAAIKFTAAIMICVMILSVLPAGTLRVQAVTKLPQNLVFYLYKDASQNVNRYVQMPYTVYKENAKVTNIKNSNPRIAKVSTFGFGLEVQPKREGEAKISFQYAGRKYSRTITVKKWENPCQKFKIGSKDFAKYYNKSEGYYYEFHSKGETVNAKISIKPKEGWRLTKIVVGYMNRKRVKNNTKIKLSLAGEHKGSKEEIFAFFKNKVLSGKLGAA